MCFDPRVYLADDDDDLLWTVPQKLLGVIETLIKYEPVFISSAAKHAVERHGAQSVARRLVQLLQEPTHGPAYGRRGGMALVTIIHNTGPDMQDIMAGESVMGLLIEITWRTLSNVVDEDAIALTQAVGESAVTLIRHVELYALCSEHSALHLTNSVLTDSLGMRLTSSGRLLFTDSSSIWRRITILSYLWAKLLLLCMRSEVS